MRWLPGGARPDGGRHQRALSRTVPALRARLVYVNGWSWPRPSCRQRQDRSDDQLRRRRTPTQPAALRSDPQIMATRSQAVRPAGWTTSTSTSAARRGHHNGGGGGASAAGCCGRSACGLERIPTACRSPTSSDGAVRRTGSRIRTGGCGPEEASRRSPCTPAPSFSTTRASALGRDRRTEAGRRIGPVLGSGDIWRATTPCG